MTDDDTSTAEPAAEIARRALDVLSDAFHARDPAGLLSSFASESGEPTYAGSEEHEIATGREAVRALLHTVLARPQRYRFHFAHVRAHRLGPIVHVLADGTGVETAVLDDERSDGTEAHPFPYRIAGTLVQEGGAWRWLLLSASEPVPALVTS